MADLVWIDTGAVAWKDTAVVWLNTTFAEAGDPILLHTTTVTGRDHALTASKRDHALTASRRTHSIGINQSRN